jgi:hypothetical protein
VRLRDQLLDLSFAEILVETDDDPRVADSYPDHILIA